MVTVSSLGKGGHWHSIRSNYMIPRGWLIRSLPTWPCHWWDVTAYAFPLNSCGSSHAGLLAALEHPKRALLSGPLHPCLCGPQRSHGAPLLPSSCRSLVKCSLSSKAFLDHRSREASLSSLLPSLWRFSQLAPHLSLRCSFLGSEA